MEKDRDSLRPIKDVIFDLLHNGTLPFNLDDSHIWKVWDEAVGPAISKHAHPYWVRNRILKVKVSDPIWLQELNYVEEDIRGKLNRKLGRLAVERIEFRAGAW